MHSHSVGVSGFTQRGIGPPRELLELLGGVQGLLEIKVRPLKAIGVRAFKFKARRENCSRSAEAVGVGLMQFESDHSGSESLTPERRRLQSNTRFCVGHAVKRVPVLDTPAADFV